MVARLWLVGALLALLLPAWARAAADVVQFGRIDIVNESGSQLPVEVTGAGFSWSALAYPGSPLSVSTPAGSFTVRPSGAPRIDVTVTPDLTTRAVIRPFGRVRVWGRLPDGGVEVVVDGRTYASIGEDATFGVPAGDIDVALVSGGHVLASDRLHVEPGELEFWTPELGTTGVVVVNPSPASVRILCPGEEQGWSVGPGASRECELPLDVEAEVRVLREHGLLLAARSFQHTDFYWETWRPETPTTGVLLVDSALTEPLRVFVDDRPARTLGRAGEVVLEVPVGRRHITAVDREGVTRLDAWVDVGPYEMGRVYFGV